LVFGLKKIDRAIIIIPDPHLFNTTLLLCHLNYFTTAKMLSSYDKVGFNPIKNDSTKQQNPICQGLALRYRCNGIA